MRHDQLLASCDCLRPAAIAGLPVIGLRKKLKKSVLSQSVLVKCICVLTGFHKTYKREHVNVCHSIQTWQPSKCYAPFRACAVQDYGFLKNRDTPGSRSFPTLAADSAMATVRENVHVKALLYRHMIHIFDYEISIAIILPESSHFITSQVSDAAVRFDGLAQHHLK